MRISHLVNPQNEPPLVPSPEKLTVSNLTANQARMPAAPNSDSDSSSDYSTERSDGDDNRSTATDFSSDELDVDIATQESEKHTLKDSFFQQNKSSASSTLDKSSNQSKKLLSTKRPRSSDNLTNTELKKKRPCDGGGVSKSAKASKAKRDSFKVGTLEISARQLGDWKKDILTDDPHAEFDPSNICRVRRVVPTTFMINYRHLPAHRHPHCLMNL